MKSAEEKTKKELIYELEQMRQRITDLESSESELKRLEGTLKHSNAQLQTLIDNAPVIICRSDLKTKVTYVNKKFEEVMGYPRQEILGKSWVTLGAVSRETAKLLMNRMVEKLKGSPPTPTEVKVKRKDGRMVWVTGIGEIIKEQGKPVGFQVIAQDITGQKQAKQKVEHAAQEWRDTFDAIPDWISIHDKNYKILRVNKAFADTFMMKPKDLIGRTCYELVHGMKEPWPECPHRQAIETGKPSGKEFYEPRLGIHVEASCSPILDGRGLTIGAVHIFRNITERKKLEDTLHKSVERYRLVTENAADVIWTVDMNMRLTYISPSVIRLLGYSVEEAMAKPMEEIYTPASYELAMKVISEELVIEKEKERDLQRSRVVEVGLNHKDGYIIPVELKCTFLHDAKARPVAILVIARDITERKQARQKVEDLYKKEKDLRQSLEEEMNRRVEFTRALVHELKTPLTPIMASSELLVDELKEKPLLKLASNIHQSASQMISRIDTLLDVAKGELGILELNYTQIDTLQLLSGIANKMLAVAHRRGLSLQLEASSSLPSVWADESRLEQVILNLLINAFKWTPKGGKVTLRAKEKDVALIVEVQDTGPGIDKENQQKIFEIYYRVERDRQLLEGLGLGLALCKTILEAHGGKIWVESEKGRGSTFGFSVPLRAGVR